MMLSKKEVEDVFSSVTASLDKSFAPPGHVRIFAPTYNDITSAPAFTHEDDVIFIDLGPGVDPYGREREVEYYTSDKDEFRRITRFTRVWSVRWILYGPSSLDHAYLLAHRIMLEQPKLIFARNGFFMIPKMDAPVQSSEPQGNTWFERADIQRTFYEAVEIDEPADHVESVDLTFHADMNGGILNG